MPVHRIKIEQVWINAMLTPQTNVKFSMGHIPHIRGTIPRFELVRQRPVLPNFVGIVREFTVFGVRSVVLPPLTVAENLQGAILGLVGHFRTLMDEVTQIEVGQAATFGLFDHP